MRVAALDLGTSRVKALAVDGEGNPLARCEAKLPLWLGKDQSAAQPIDSVIDATNRALRGVVDRCADGGVEALAVSGAMHSLAPLDENGQPLAAAMTWADRRAAAVADAMAGEVEDLEALYRRTGCPWSVLYHPPRLRWWAERQPDAARWVGLKDAAIDHLTGRRATDTSLASATGLLDIHAGRWDEAALNLAGIRAAALPELVEPKAIVGRLTAAAAAATGLAVGLPVIAGASDGALANVGAGAGAGEMVVTVGTSAAVRRLVDRPLLHPAQRTWCYIAPWRRWLAGAAMNSGGIAVDHMAREAYEGEADPWAALTREAAAVPIGSEGVMVMPFVNGERDLIWPRQAGWRVEGFDGDRHRRGHLARATLEAVAMAVATLWEAVGSLEGDEQRPPAEVRLTGGITRSTLWRQMLADVLGVTLRPIDAADASAMGAAVLAIDAITGRPPSSLTMEPQGTVRPNGEHHEAYQTLGRRWSERCRALGWWLESPSGRYSL